MARPVRIQFPGAVYHVTARGNEKREIFRNDHDRLRFFETLEECVERFLLDIFVHCLMPNHFHLVAGTPEGNLSRAMAWLQTTYSVRFNRRYFRSGHLYQGRFKAHLVDSDVYGRELVKYIHLNPVRPRDRKRPIPPERKPDLLEYKWSSHLAYLGDEKAPEWLSLDWLKFWGKSGKEARIAYREDIDAAFGNPIVSPLEGARGGLVLGGDALWNKARDLIESASGADEIRLIGKEDHLARLRAGKKTAAGQEDRRHAIWIRGRLGGERMADIARDFGYRDGSGPLRVIQRLEAKAAEDKALARVLEGIRRVFNLSIVKS